MKPSAKDINTATQSEIGSFQDEKISKKLILTEDDHKMYEKWDFLSKRSFQEEVVDFLTFEERVVRFYYFWMCLNFNLFSSPNRICCISVSLFFKYFLSSILILIPLYSYWLIFVLCLFEC
jgi:hypothetical protein